MYVLYVQNRFHCKVKASGGITIIPLCVYVCVYVHASVCVCVCMCVCVCVYTQIATTCVQTE